MTACESDNRAAVQPDAGAVAPARPARPTIADRAADPAALDGTLVLELGYRGAGFSGFAAQPGQRTVAGEVTRALETLLRRPTDLTCAAVPTPACTRLPST